jgi:hypothetical protein
MYRTPRSKTEFARLTVTAVVLLSATLAGCADHLYVDRRETISPIAGDAQAVNRVVQGVDPWSRASANNNIAFNGEKMQTASERYRMGRVIPPVNVTTSTAAYSQAAQGAQSTANNQAASAPSSTPIK